MFYVLQDGPDFYLLYSDEELENVVYVVKAPFRFGDYDMGGAERTRAWFERQNYSGNVVWVD